MHITLSILYSLLKVDHNLNSPQDIRDRIRLLKKCNELELLKLQELFEPNHNKK